MRIENITKTNTPMLVAAFRPPSTVLLDHRDIIVTSPKSSIATLFPPLVCVVACMIDNATHRKKSLVLTGCLSEMLVTFRRSATISPVFWINISLRIMRRMLYDRTTTPTATRTNHLIDVVSGSSSLTCIPKKVAAKERGINMKASLTSEANSYRSFSFVDISTYRAP